MPTVFHKIKDNAYWFFYLFLQTNFYITKINYEDISNNLFQSKYIVSNNFSQVSGEKHAWYSLKKHQHKNHALFLNKKSFKNKNKIYRWKLTALMAAAPFPSMTLTTLYVPSRQERVKDYLVNLNLIFKKDRKKKQESTWVENIEAWGHGP